MMRTDWVVPLRRYADLSAVMCLVAGVAVVTAFGSDSATPASIAVGSAFLLVAPGYALVAALFPAAPGRVARAGDGGGEDTPALVERIALAVGASLALAVVAGVGLSVLPWGLTAGTVVAGLGTTTVACVLVAAGRRRRRSTGGSGTVDAPAASPSAPAVGGRSSLGLALCGAVAVGWIGFLLLGGAGAGTAGFTEFALLTQDDGEYVASGYPSQFVANEPRSVHLSIENREGRRTTYTVGVFAQRTSADDPTVIRSSRRIDRFTATVGAGETVRRHHGLTIPITGEVRVEYRLYRGTPQNLTRAGAIERLHLWATVSGAENG